MSYKNAREDLKVYLPDYVNMIAKPDKRAGHNMYKCPLCGSGTRSHGTGAFSIKPNGIGWKCFVCLKGGDIFDLIGFYEDIADKTEQLKRAADIFNYPLGEGSKAMSGNYSQGAAAPVKKEAPAKETEETKKPTPGKYTKYIGQCIVDAGKTNYFASRGFTQETIERFNLGYDVSKKAIVIPYSLDNSYYITRNLVEGKEGRQFRKPKTEEAGEEPIFNMPALYGNQPCFICEAPLDAISIMQAGGSAISIGGTGAEKLRKQIKEKRPQCALIISTDNDVQGNKAAENISEILDHEGLKHIRAVYSYDKYSGAKKDANDLLRANEEQLRQDIRRNEKAIKRKEPFIPYRVSDYLRSGDFSDDINYFKEYQHRKTGFENLDKHLTLYPGLAALGGCASLGKSTFAVNLADNLIESGETVLYFALEQEPIELITKSLARRLYRVDPLSPINNIDIKNGATSVTLEQVKQDYLENAERFIIVRCNFTTTAEDIKSYVERFISDTGIRPIVFIDYLQLISPPEGFKGDIRVATDHIVKLLKTMQLDNELFVVMISNFNRNSYAAPVSYESFKETGMIEFTCDYIWGLQLSLLEDEEFNYKDKDGKKETSQRERRELIHEANMQNPKEVEFVCIKNRNGRQHFKGFFKYRMDFDSFTPDLNSPHDNEGVSFKGFEKVSKKEAPPNPFI